MLPQLSKCATALLICTTLLGTSLPVTAESLVIHAGDKLQLTVFNHPELSIEGSVTSDGFFSSPYIGASKLAGLDVHLAARSVEERLRNYIKFPSASITVESQASSIFFSGAFSGTAVYIPGENLTAAIGSLANSSTSSNPVSLDAADLRNVTIKRDGRVLIQKFNFEQLSRLGEPGPTLQPGDTIIMPAKSIRVVVRGTTKSVRFVYLRQGDSLAQALAADGDIPAGSSNLARLDRSGTTTLISLSGQEISEPAADGDELTIMAPPHVTVVGNVLKPGDTALTNQHTLLSALYAAGGPNDHADLGHVIIKSGNVQTVHDVSRILKGDTNNDVPVADGDMIIVGKGNAINTSSLFAAIAALASLKFLTR